MKTLGKLIGWLLLLALVLVGVGLALTHQATIAPQAAPAPASFAPLDVERGRRLAALGDCAVCHTAPGGKPNAGGLAIESPFGAIYATNITPDVQTGIGSWSFAAFERAMRHGVDREGRYLYPAFPYTAFTHTTGEDLKALYAYLMSQPAVANDVPKTALKFPYNVRPGIAAWNWLYLRPGDLETQANQSPEWHRGRYLAEGLGHCSACHTPRNQLGAEQGGEHHFAGSFIDGWDVPALTSATAAPLAWTQEDLVRYMKTGFSERHGVAAGPMGPVIHGLSQQSDEDLRAIASYLISFKDRSADQGDAAKFVQQRRDASQVPLDAPGLRVYQGACMGCHRADAGGVLAASNFGVRPQLGLATSLHAKSPTNAIQVVLNGIQEPALPDLGTMPAFRYTYSDAQVADLLNTMRGLYGLTPWPDLATQVGRLRESTAHQAPAH